MSLEPYRSYENRGVDWIDRYPTGWMATRLSRLLRGIKDGTHGTFARVDQGRPLLSAKNVQDWGLKIDESESQISEDDFREIVANGYPVYGDVALTIVGTIGRACVYRLPSATAFQRSVCFLRPGKALAPEFLKYQIQADVFQEQLRLRTKVSAQPGVYMGDIASIGVLVPTQVEQHQIVEYLDGETAEIDAFIADQEELIALLNERRAATITQAVTKGIDPTAPMKDSGVEWIGDVPVDWDVRQIKWISRVKRGASPRPIDNPDYFDEDGVWSWVRIADVSASDGKLRETTQKLSKLGSGLSVKLEPGQLFVSIAGTVGKPCITEIKACIHDGFVYFPDLSPVLRTYLYRIFEAGQCYLGLGKLGTQLNLNTDTIGSISIPMPPAAVVSDLLVGLDHALNDLDETISDAQRAIALSKERRAALISAAVTGKIDVRGAMMSKQQSLEGERVVH